MKRTIKLRSETIRVLSDLRIARGGQDGIPYSAASYCLQASCDSTDNYTYKWNCPTFYITYCR